MAFSFDGQNYEIDLSKRNKAAFEKAVKPYVDAARKVRATRGRSTSGRSSSSSRQNLQAVREWARANGHEVSDRGRISQEIQDAYAASR